MTMYMKNLTETVRLRLTDSDMTFLTNLSEKRACSVSECIRSIIGEYRRSVESMEAISTLIQMTNDGSIVDLAKKIKESEGSCPNGDTNPNINSKL